VTYPAAAPLAGVVAEGEAKPEATLTATVTPYSLETIAHWVQATRQLLEDSAAVRSFIESSLRRGVLDKIEATIAAAIGAATLPTATGADLISAIRVGVADVEDAGYTPNAIVLNPQDYAALDIAVMGGTLLGPTVRPSYWGLPVVASSAQTAGTALVGDFTAGVQLLQRTGVSLYISDSHASTFTSNIFTLLAEARVKAIVGQPSAVVECSKTP
jgi:HK97 family phage major capsid protein